MSHPSRLSLLRAQGFDGSSHIPFTKQYRVVCTSCDALVIQGIPCHESGCPSQVHECRGCNATVERAGAYCADCSGYGWDEAGFDKEESL